MLGNTLQAVRTCVRAKKKNGHTINNYYAIGKTPFIFHVIRLFVGIVEAFYDDHTIEGPFHGNGTATLY